MPSRFAFHGKPGTIPGFWLFIVLLFIGNLTLQAQEFRGLWADTFHAGMRTSAEVTAMVNQLRAANFNAVVVEVRKRGDAYYNSNFEPKASDVNPQSFDPLADLIAKAHNTNGGAQRIEVHAWIVTYPIWNNPDINAAPAGHPIRLHPDWLSQTEGGENFNGNYLFDPAHPAVQQHTFNVCMDIISRYDVDGLNFDYVRYYGNEWGYNPVAVDRFNRRFNRSGSPARTDPAWLQFRRDQVSSLVRKVYLHSAAIKPLVKISADTICFAPGVRTAAEWTNSAAAYTSVLQDWRSWMEEGILDLNIPMAYFDHRRWDAAWTNWSIFTKDHQYNRHAVMGPGIYLNTMSNLLFQMRHTRQPSPLGNSARGLCGYSYAVPVTNDTPRSTFFSSVVNANAYETNTVPIFATRDAPHPMPWKTTPTKGHIKGFVYLGNTNTPIDGASFNVAGPASRSGISDATGFYGTVDLAPGTYTVAVSAANALPASSNITVTAGMVATANFILTFSDTTAPSISGVEVLDITDTSARIVWNTDESADSIVQWGTTISYDRGATNSALVNAHSMQLSSLLPNTVYHYRVGSRDASNNQASSADFVFQTNPSGVVSDLIVDNPDAAIVGSWAIGNSATDKYGADYRFESVGTGANYVHFAPNILTPGNYAVYEWHSQGGNRTFTAPHRVTHKNGTTNVIVDQSINGGRWNYLGTFAFNQGAGGYVRITDAIAEPTGKVVIADAIKFVFVPDPVGIATHPASRTITAGQSVSFSVIATGSPPFTYQWRFNGTNLPGASASLLELSGVDGFDAGIYSVRVSNLVDGVTSADATLTVLPSGPPDILSITLIPNHAQLIVSGDPGFNYTLVGSSNLVNWTDLQSLRPSVNPFPVLDPRGNAPQRFYKIRRDN